MRAARTLFALKNRLEQIPYGLLALVARAALVIVFWRAGQSKVDGWQITETTFALFREEYRVPLLSPEIAAYLATAQEHLFAILLAIGLASRLGALGLLGMTAVTALDTSSGLATACLMMPAVIAVWPI